MAKGGSARSSAFRTAEYTGELNSDLVPVDLERSVERLTDPGQATETVHWGRNYLYSVDVETVSGRREVVVKQFRNRGLAARLKRRWTGSKATKSWRAAWALLAAGVRTPVPILLAESLDPEGPSFYGCAKIGEFFESRYYFRALQAGTERQQFPDVDRESLIQALATTCRKLHDAGIWHRDLSIGNLLIGQEGGAPTITVIDLNRTRLIPRLGLWRRTRDLCRLPFPEPDSRRRFLAGYWGRPVGTRGLRYMLFWLLQQGFLLKKRSKAAARSPLHAVRDLLRERQPHAHIPDPSPKASVRDKVVWDHLSDQPHQHATRSERAQVRIADLAAHSEAVVAVGRALPRIWHRYRQLRRELFERRVPWTGAGIALRPRPEDPESLLETLGATGITRVLIRLHPWEFDHEAEIELASELHRRGYELAFAIPQNRDLVRDPERWSAVVDELAERFSPFGRHFQIGQAVNRSKWGVWTYREYLELARRASSVLRRHEGTVIMGPAVIDFEFQATAALLNMEREGVFFDVVSSLLYVDRRGAPENPQLGFDSPAKAALLKAIAETGKSSSGSCWVTEVNWPLWEGPHSPAGRTVSVDEQTQADYLCRYYLLMLASGMVERVYWWRLIARGYGLVEPGAEGDLRRRPSHRALSTLERELGDGAFLRLLDAPADVRLMLFENRAGEEVVVGWSLAGSSTVQLPRAAGSTCHQDGSEHNLDGRRQVEILPSPTYFRLED